MKVSSNSIEELHNQLTLLEIEIDNLEQALAKVHEQTKHYGEQYEYTLRILRLFYKAYQEQQMEPDSTLIEPTLKLVRQALGLPREPSIQ